MIGIFGDYQVSRSLPHSTTDEQGRDRRYEFQKRLLDKALEPFNTTFHLGDLTDKKNFIDGKIFKDHLEIFKDRKSYHIIGNHDRSQNPEKYFSMAEALSKVIDGFEVVAETGFYKTNNNVLVMTSYYASEEQIILAVEETLSRTNQDIFVLGHWSLYTEQRGGKKLWDFAHKHQGKVWWVLGHEHNPQTITVRGKEVGRYLGCVNPLRFGERQGKIMVMDDRIEFRDYPFGEKFITTTVDSIPEIDEPDLTYLKIKTEDEKVLSDQQLKERYADLVYFSINYEPGKSVLELDSKAEEIKDLEDYIALTCQEFDYDEQKIFEYHRKVKEENNAD